MGERGEKELKRGRESESTGLNGLSERRERGTVSHEAGDKLHSGVFHPHKHGDRRNTRGTGREQIISEKQVCEHTERTWERTDAKTHSQDLFLLIYDMASGRKIVKGRVNGREREQEGSETVECIGIEL